MNFIINETAKKLRGGYYTPIKLASFISQWVVGINTRSILEPSCGDGIFLETINSLCNNFEHKIEFLGLELEQEEASKAYERANYCHNLNSSIINDDFLSWVIGNLDQEPMFDAVVGNPPFIRYQYLPDLMQDEAETIFKFLNIKFTKHTNAWVPFVLASLHMLKPGGRFGMVVPAEILHVIHAQSVRSYISNVCSKILIFDPEDIWFEDTLQGAVILLAEKKEDPNSKSQGLSIIQTKGLDFTQTNPSEYFNNANYTNGDTLKGKWTYALLSRNEFSVYKSLLKNSFISKFADIADVDVGIVTGANNFFLVNDKIVQMYDLSSYAHPMFGRSEHCPGIVYDINQHLKNAQKSLPTNFIWFDSNENFSYLQKQYISLGESQGLHTRYKCRIRKPWYKVPSVYATPLCMLKRSHDIPRLIVNRLNAYTTDTAYRIKMLKPEINPDLLAYSFINSLTALSAELEGRHYGGGVLELVPSEIEKLLIPISSKIIPFVEELDSQIRTLKTEDVLSLQDRNVLANVGLSPNEIITLQNAWFRLKNRRQRVEN